MPRNKGSIKSKIKKQQRKKLKAKQQKRQKKTQQPKQTILLDKKLLLKKYDINLGAKNYSPSKHHTSKSIHIDKFSLMQLGGGNELLHNTELHIKEGSIYGLIGQNGFGKTTLLKAMYEYQIEGFPSYIRMVLVDQHQQKNKNINVLQCVLESDILRQQLQETENKLLLTKQIFNNKSGINNNSLQSCVLINIIDSLLDIFDCGTQVVCNYDYNYKQEEIEEILDIINEEKKELDFDHSEIKAIKILTGLGFTMDMIKNKNVCDLSGGWQTRVKLASALFIEPDLMLLDEPTNHLDFPTVLWLQHYLTNYCKTVIIISHDKSFINTVCNKTILLNKQKLTYYPGNYDTMIKSQNILKTQSKHQYKDYKKEFKILQKDIQIYIQKWANIEDKQQKSVINQKRKRFEFLKCELNKLEPLMKEDKPLKFSFHSTRKKKKELLKNVKLENYVIKMQNICFKYDNMQKMLLKNINLTLTTDSRIGMIGANGVGKTTLIKLIMGDLFAISGLCDRNRSARISLFTQHHAEQLNLKQSAIQYIYSQYKDDDEMKEAKNKEAYIRSKLGRFKLTGKQHTTIMENLSGGEKSRVAFCIACWKEPHFLIMDEPTNHLDIDSVKALIDAIKSFNGGCLVISHDQYFLSQIGREFWSVTSNGIKQFDEFNKAKQFALEQRMLNQKKNRNKKKDTKWKPRIKNKRNK